MYVCMQDSKMAAVLSSHLRKQERRATRRPAWTGSSWRYCDVPSCSILQYMYVCKSNGVRLYLQHRVVCEGAVAEVQCAQL